MTMLSAEAVAMSPLLQGLASVAQECVVLFVFFATWSLTRSYSQVKEVAPEKKAQGRDPLATAELIRSLCADQFTRALRLYRDLVKQGTDKEITEEPFYTSLVEAAVRCGKADVAMQILERMKLNGLPPSSPFLQSVFKMLSARKLYRECLEVHRQFGFGPTPEPVVFSCVILGAAELGELKLARELVDARQLPSREAIPLVRAYAKQNDWEAAVSLVSSFVARGAVVENLVLNSCLACCARVAEALPAMQALLDEVVTFEATAQVRMADIVSYNTLMKAHAKAHDLEACFALLEAVLRREDGLAPDGVTFSTLLDVCIQEDQHDRAAVALERMGKSGVKMTCVLLTTLMKGFVRSSRLDKAFQVYATMKSGTVKPDMITYSLLIKACCDSGQMDQALQVLEDLLQSGCTVDDVVFTHLLDGSCQISNVALAEQLFRDMLKARIQPTVYAITGLLKVYGKCGLSEKALAVVATMEQSYGVKPTVVVYTCVMSGLLRQKKHAEAYATFQQMMERCELDTQCVQTMLYGLTEGMMWTQFNDVAAQFLARGTPPISADCLNHALQHMVQKDSVQSARVLHGMMEKHGVEVRLQDARKSLRL